jgi:hypothetical protein
LRAEAGDHDVSVQSKGRKAAPQGPVTVTELTVTA